MPNFNHLTIADAMAVLFRVEAMDTRRKRGGSSHKLSSLFGKLKTAQQAEIARYGIERHLYYCRKANTAISPMALAEIIRDASNGINQAEQNEIEAREVRELKRPLPISSLFGIHTLRRVGRKPALS